MDIIADFQESASLRLNIRHNMEFAEESVYANYSDVIGLFLREKIFEADILPKESAKIFVKKLGGSFADLKMIGGRGIPVTDRFSDHPDYFPSSGEATLFAFSYNTMINTKTMLDRLRTGPAPDGNGKYLKIKNEVFNDSKRDENRYDKDSITLDSLGIIPLNELIIAGYGEHGNFIVRRSALVNVLKGRVIDQFNRTYAKMPGLNGFLFPTSDRYNPMNLNEERSERVKSAYSKMNFSLKWKKGENLPYIDAFMSEFVFQSLRQSMTPETDRVAPEDRRTGNPLLFSLDSDDDDDDEASPNFPRSIYEAVQRNDDRGVESYIEAGDDVNQIGPDGETPLMMAVGYNREDIFITLLDSNDIDINATDINGKTALMVAAELGRFELAEELVRRDVDTEQEDDNGRTALDYTTNQENRRIFAGIIGYIRRNTGIIGDTSSMEIGNKFTFLNKKNFKY